MAPGEKSLARIAKLREAGKYDAVLARERRVFRALETTFARLATYNKRGTPWLDNDNERIDMEREYRRAFRLRERLADVYRAEGWLRPLTITNLIHQYEGEGQHAPDA